MIMKGLFFLTCILEAVLQIILIAEMKQKKDFKYWNMFLGTTFAIFISDFIAYFSYTGNDMGLSDGLLSIIVCGIPFILSLILLIIGVVVRGTIKDDGFKLNKTAPITGIIVLFINIIVLFTIPAISYQATIKTGEKYLMKYLKESYGDSNYKVINVYKEYSNSGMWDRYLSGYIYEIKCDYTEHTFMVTMDDDLNKIDDDYFLPVYYSEKNGFEFSIKYDDWYYSVNSNFTELNTYIKNNVKEKYQIDYIYSYDIYEPYTSYFDEYEKGKIPELEEVINQLVKHKDKEGE